MSGAPDDDPKKREILNPDDTLQGISGDPDDRAKAHARAAGRVLEEEAKRKHEEEQRRLGWHGRLWNRLRAFVERNFAAPWAAVTGFFVRRLPRTARFVGAVFGGLARVWQRALWPFLRGVSIRTDKDGHSRLSLTGKLLLAAAVFVVAWPFFKIYYVLGTARDFHGVQITFKQIITQDRYLVFGDYTDDAGQKENMAFNITDSWVYWNWTPDLMFAQVPVVGKCNFHTYGWYVRVPRFVPLIGRTLLVEPVVIEAACTDATNLLTAPGD
jgi:hypothetical protein